MRKLWKSINGTVQEVECETSVIDNILTNNGNTDYLFTHNTFRVFSLDTLEHLIYQREVWETEVQARLHARSILSDRIRELHKEVEQLQVLDERHIQKIHEAIERHKIEESYVRQRGR